MDERENGQGSPVDPVVRAERFELVGKDGKPQATLLVNKMGEPELAMYDGAGERRAMLTVTTCGPAVVLFDGDGKPRATLGVTRGPGGLGVKSDMVGLGLHDEEGEQRALLGMDAAGASLRLFKSDGELLWRAP